MHLIFAPGRVEAGPGRFARLRTPEELFTFPADPHDLLRAQGDDVERALVEVV
jgi:hypothetical protein